MKKKYIFLDIDGTIVDYDFTMRESCVRALHKAQENGHKLILSTGRFKGQIYSWLFEKVAFDGMITSCGAAVHYKGKRVYESFFDGEQLKKLSAALRSSGAIFTGQCETSLVTDRENADAIHALYESAGVKREDVTTLIGRFDIMPLEASKSCEKLMYYNANIDHDAMRALIGDAYTVDPFVFKSIAGNCGEISIAGISKASGIREFVLYMGGSMEDTISFGDSDNDVSMIKAAKIGIAMGNAPESLKSHADMITDRIENDGIYNAFLKLGLI